VLGGVLAVALICWVVTIDRMRGMDAGPGTDLGSFGWFVGVWVTMMTAMMLPSALPTIRLFARARDSGDTIVFVAGYILAWTAYGVVAYAAYRGLRAIAPGYVRWDDHGPLVAGAALVLAGIYQLTPLKTACLRHCRSPLHFLLHARPGIRGSLRTGLEHGAICVGCCAGLMLALFALGVMSIVWMAVLTLVILAEKALPGGERVSRIVALALIGVGIWVAVAPSSVPGLTQPTSMAPMSMS
jgi:predicted metal-binding membrane protein